MEPEPSVLRPSAAASSGVTAFSAPVSNTIGNGPRPSMLTATITKPASTEIGTTASGPMVIRESNGFSLPGGALSPGTNLSVSAQAASPIIRADAIQIRNPAARIGFIVKERPRLWLPAEKQVFDQCGCAEHQDH